MLRHHHNRAFIQGVGEQDHLVDTTAGDNRNVTVFQSIYLNDSRSCALASTLFEVEVEGNMPHLLWTIRRSVDRRHLIGYREYLSLISPGNAVP